MYMRASCIRARLQNSSYMILSPPLNEKFDMHHRPLFQSFAPQSVHSNHNALLWLVVPDCYKKNSFCSYEKTAIHLISMRFALFGHHRSFIVTRAVCAVKFVTAAIPHVIRVKIRNVIIMENANGETIRQRKREPENDVTELSSDTEEQEKKKEPMKKNFKYYFNRFRYYHYYCVEKIESFITVICMWIIKIQFYFMGYRINGLPSIYEIEEKCLNDA
ncbi:PREDICTED: uncharacterized protein LOC105564950 [Vollenhovia emeryi]|uniref:uncharacterized protein LOC105564950 n=1 Tax=Vollenhovia emeryi TaxID=411798 RepID=UPI0005F3AFFE|nr:PREDICTED: uncharacterized protein LOC105564950 [Vollenhovia emeryi]